uniref:Uncharacterized protein n=1 Tax=Arundo donax TaxID=35708 RepID=A0A0A8ZFC0_ARUDO
MEELIWVSHPKKSNGSHVTGTCKLSPFAIIMIF